MPRRYRDRSLAFETAGDRKTDIDDVLSHGAAVLANVWMQSFCEYFEQQLSKHFPDHMRHAPPCNSRLSKNHKLFGYLLLWLLEALGTASPGKKKLLRIRWKALAVGWDS